VRVAFFDNDTIMQRNDYYPFGMSIAEISYQKLVGNYKNTYLYNGKEFQGDLGLNWHDYGARFYDAAIGRFHSLDPLAEITNFQSPYIYANNSPINNIDFMGLSAVGADGLTNEQWMEASRPGGGGFDRMREYQKQNRDEENRNRYFYNNLLNSSINDLEKNGFSGYYTLVDGIIQKIVILGLGEWWDDKASISNGIGALGLAYSNWMEFGVKFNKYMPTNGEFAGTWQPFYQTTKSGKIKLDSKGNPKFVSNNAKARFNHIKRIKLGGHAFTIIGAYFIYQDYKENGLTVGVGTDIFFTGFAYVPMVGAPIATGYFLGNIFIPGGWRTVGGIQNEQRILNTSSKGINYNMYNDFD